MEITKQQAEEALKLLQSYYLQTKFRDECVYFYTKHIHPIENELFLKGRHEGANGDITQCPICGGSLQRKNEYNCHPYGDDIQYDQCMKCDEKYNFKVIR